MDSSSVGQRSLVPYCLTQDLNDPWRCLHTTERDYTNFSLVHKSYSRIDFFLTDKYTLQKVTKATIHNITWSDHAPITVNIEDMLKVHHAPLWHNNTYLLSNPQIKEEIQNKLEKYFMFNNTTDCNPSTVWCAYKALSRGALIQIATRERKKKKHNVYHNYPIALLNWSPNINLLKLTTTCY